MGDDERFSENASVNDESFLELFSPSTNVKLSLSFSNLSLYSLSNAGVDDEKKYSDVYFPADLAYEVGGKTGTIEEIGVRMKGNTSRKKFVDGDGNISSPSHFKVNFKATFDDDLYSLPQFSSFRHDWSNDASGRKERKKRKFFTLSKLDLKYLPRNDNATYSEEIFSYESFRNAGIPSPYARWGKLAIADEADSQQYDYELIETIDKEFFERRFSAPNLGGDLYKCVWGTDSSGSWTGADLARSGAIGKEQDANGLSIGERLSKGRIGVEDNLNKYHPNYDLKTNDDGESSDFSKIVNYIRVIYDCRNGKRGYEDLSSVLHLDEFLRFEAVSYLLGNFDDQRNNANNYYLYFLPSSGKAIYIPYDWDWGINTSRGAESYSIYQTTGIDGKTIDTNVYYATFFDNDKVTYSLSSMKKTYEGYINQFFDAGYLEEKNYVSFVNSLSGHLDVSGDDVSSYFSAKKSLVAKELKELGY